MTAAKSGDSFSNAIPGPLAPEPRAGDPHRHLSPCSEVSKRVARLGGRLDLSQLDISRGFTAFSSGSSWRLVTISCEPVTKYDELLESSCEERKAHRLRYFARRFSLLETNCQMVVTSSTRSAKQVTK
jgi:hypothetical protein